MGETVGDFLVQRLQEWGIQRMYGYPGDGINGIMGALNRAGNRPEFIQVRHEEMAASAITTSKKTEGPNRAVGQLFRECDGAAPPAQPALKEWGPGPTDPGKVLGAIKKNDRSPRIRPNREIRVSRPSRFSRLSSCLRRLSTLSLFPSRANRC